MARSRSSGSHYALTTIGLGMVVLGVIMAVWNLVPAFGPTSKPHTFPGNSSKHDTGGGGLLQSKTFSVAYVLIGAGVLLLLFSICLAVRDRMKPRRNDIIRIQHQVSVEHRQQEDSQEEDDDTPSRYYVPSYEEVMNTDYPDLRDVDRNARISMSLPSYESLTGIDETTPTRPAAAAAAAAAAEGRPNIERQPSRHSSRLSKRLKPLKVRRIKSEKLHLKNIRLNLPDGNSANRITIEPLTPPPQYDEIPKKLPESGEDT